MTIFDPESDDTRPLAVLDFEASCLPAPGASFPIEVGVAYIDTDEVRSWLIKPITRWREKGVWDPAAEKLHGITREQLERDGLPVDVVCSELTATIAGHCVLSDNVGADDGWLSILFAAVGQEVPFRLESALDLAREALRSCRPGLVTSDMDTVIIDALRCAKERHPVEHRAGPDAARWAEALRLLGEAT